jgi:transposase-like protein
MEQLENITQQTEQKQSGPLTPAVVAEVFGAEFLSQTRCQLFIASVLHGDAPRCLGCGAAIPSRMMRSFCDGRRIRCDACGKFFNVFSGTFLSGTHFSSREVVLLALLLGLGVQDKEIARILKISAESVRLWRLKFLAQEKISKGNMIG